MFLNSLRIATTKTIKNGISSTLYPPLSSSFNSNIKQLFYSTNHLNKPTTTSSTSINHKDSKINNESEKKINDDDNVEDKDKQRKDDDNQQQQQEQQQQQQEQNKEKLFFSIESGRSLLNSLVTGAILCDLFLSLDPGFDKVGLRRPDCYYIKEYCEIGTKTILPISAHMSEKDFFIFSNMVAYKAPFETVFHIMNQLLHLGPYSDSCLASSGIEKFCYWFLSQDVNDLYESDPVAKSKGLNQFIRDKMKYDQICIGVLKSVNEISPLDLPPHLNNLDPLLKEEYEPHYQISDRLLYKILSFNDSLVAGTTAFLYTLVRSRMPGFRGNRFLTILNTTIFSSLLVSRFRGYPLVSPPAYTSVDREMMVRYATLFFFITGRFICKKNYWLVPCLIAIFTPAKAIDQYLEVSITVSPQDIDESNWYKE